MAASTLDNRPAKRSEQASWVIKNVAKPFASLAGHVAQEAASLTADWSNLFFKEAGNSFEAKTVNAAILPAELVGVALIALGESKSVENVSTPATPKKPDPTPENTKDDGTYEAPGDDPADIGGWSR